jgi:hypothetical protein
MSFDKTSLKDYIDVAERIGAFKAAHPEGSLQSEIVHLSDNRVIVKAYAFRNAEDQRPGVGHAAEQIPGATPYTRGSEVMVAETSAWGRAIAALGFEVKRGIATRQEVETARGRQEQSVEDRNLTDAWADDVKVLPPVERTEAKRAVDGIALAASGTCPVHRMVWVYREGTSAKGPYAFWACPSPKDASGYCKERPNKAWEEAQR